VAIEWSGLESRPSPGLQIKAPAVLHFLDQPPKDLSWTEDRWSVQGRRVPVAEAKRADQAVCERVHLHDGVIRRSWHRRGEFVRQHDLNAEGKAIRRLEFRGGRLAMREYYDRSGKRVSLEKLSLDGWITESIRHRHVGGVAHELDRWWYDRGTPVRRVMKGRSEFVKRSNDCSAVKT
jgi:hypothetical protein